jgi:hypothetical protein
MEQIRPDNVDVNAQRPDNGNLDAQRPDNVDASATPDAQAPAQSPAPALRAAYRQAGGLRFGLLGERPYHVEVMTDDSVWGVFEDGSREPADPAQADVFLLAAGDFVDGGAWETFDPSPAVNVNAVPESDSNPKPVFYRLRGCLFGGLGDDTPTYLSFDGAYITRIDAVTGLPQGEPWQAPAWLSRSLAEGSIAAFDPDNALDWVPLIGRDERGLYVLTTMRWRTRLPDAMVERLPALKEAVSRLMMQQAA